MKAGVTYLSDHAYAAAGVSDSTIFNYNGGQYLHSSVTVDGKETNLSINTSTVVRSFTMYDDSRDQKLLYTWNMKAGVTYLVSNAYAAAGVSDSTIFNYNGGQY